MGYILMPDTAELNIEQMRAAAERATALLRVLAHEDRLLLLCQLSQRELCVGELEEQLDIHQPMLSQQLGVLRRQELVTTRRDGKRIYYRIADPRALTLLQTLYSLYCDERDTRNDD
jgi:DNA-binding transcriptional ArsR family regulator